MRIGRPPARPARTSGAKIVLITLGAFVVLCCGIGAVVTGIGALVGSPDSEPAALATSSSPSASPSPTPSASAALAPAALPSLTVAPPPSQRPSPRPTRTTAKASPTPRRTTSSPKTSCDPNYSGDCVPIASDVDCGGGSGDGPAYFWGVARVVGTDKYRLDADKDGWACEKD
ncbi:MAG: hypothetical protein HOV79_25700 [Hamadaea sp.]|nr:hypothetical protein [Hamadaea sp.]